MQVNRQILNIKNPFSMAENLNVYILPITESLSVKLKSKL